MKRLVLAVTGAVAAMFLQYRRHNGSLVFGEVLYHRELLEARKREGRPLNATVIGVARFAGDVPADVVRESVSRLRVIGVLIANQEARRGLAGRTSITGTVVKPDSATDSPAAGT